jgi:hypothetical protein
MTGWAWFWHFLNIRLKKLTFKFVSNLFFIPLILSSGTVHFLIFNYSWSLISLPAENLRKMNILDSRKCIRELNRKLRS